MAQQAAVDGAPLVAGWYGKMPCLGDFASRRLPSDFIAAWDAWLQRSIAASRRDLGERWLDTFLTSPMWRFALGAGVCGAHAYAGIVFPSVDKVGRYFPMTLALPLPAHVSAAGLPAAHEWYEGLETIGLATLDVACSPDRLEHALAQHPLTGAGPAQALTPPHAASSPSTLSFATADAFAAAMSGAAVDGHGVWWSVAHDTGAVECHRSAGLPPESYFTVMLRGPGETQATPVDPLQAFDEARR